MNHFSEDDVVRCKICGKINPHLCYNPDCPMEEYFWSMENNNDE